MLACVHHSTITQRFHCPNNSLCSTSLPLAYPQPLVPTGLSAISIVFAFSVMSYTSKSMWPFQIKFVYFLIPPGFCFWGFDGSRIYFHATPWGCKTQHDHFTVCRSRPSDSYLLLLDVYDPKLYDHLSGTAEKGFLHQKRGDSFRLR